MGANENGEFTACPSSIELARYDRGQLSTDEIDRVTRHLESGCSSCSAFLESVPVAADELATMLRIAAEVKRDATLTTQIGRYQIQSILGRGGMGIVYRAYDPARKRLVAVKLLTSSNLLKAGAVARFQREAATMAEVHHPNIVRLLDFGDHQEQQFLVTEFIEGETLDQYVTQKSLIPRDCAELMVRLASAVEAMHARGILHRDLKPSNVLVSTAGVPKLLDFGLARSLASDETRLTMSGAILGTPSYMSPEQAAGSQPDTPTTDVYALGATFYELLTGRPPFMGANAMAILQQVTNAEPIAPRQLHPAIPPDLDTICLKCLEKQPAKRYATPAALADDLNRFLEGRPIEARSLSRFCRTVRWGRRNPWPVTFMLTLVAVLAVVTNLAVRERRARLGAEYEDYILKIHMAEQETRSGRLMQVQHELDGCPDHLRGIEWNLLDNLSHREAVAFPHDSQPQLVSWSPDGRRLATFDAQTLRIWEVTSKSLQSSLRIPEYFSAAVYWPQDRVYLVTQNRERLIAVELTTGRELAAYDGMGSRTDDRVRISLDSTGCWLAAATGKRIVIWNTHTREKVADWIATEGKLLDLRLLPQGNRIVTISRPNGLQMWEFPSGRLVRSFEGHERPLSCMALSADGKRIATGTLLDPRSGSLEELKIWETDSVCEVASVLSHQRGIHSLNFHPKGDSLLSADANGTMHHWNLTSVESKNITLLRSYRSHGRFNEVVFDPTGENFATMESDRFVRVWKSGRVQGPLKLTGHPKSGVFSMAISPDGRTIATGGSLGVVKLTDAQTGLELRSFVGLEDVVFSLAFSADGQRLAGVGRGKQVQGMMWNVQTGEALAKFEGEGTDLTTVAFDPSGRQLVTAGEGGIARVWDGITGQKIADWSLDLKSIDQVAFAADGRIAIVSTFGELRVFDRPHGRELRRFPTLPGRLRMAFSPDPDGRWLVASVGKTCVEVYDSHTGALRHTFTGTEWPIASLAVHPNGRRIATGGVDWVVRLWDLDTGREVLSLYDHPAAITTVAFSAAGDKLVTAGWANTTFVWDIGNRTGLPGPR